MECKHLNYNWDGDAHRRIAFLVSKGNIKIVYNDQKSILVLPTKGSKLKFRCDNLTDADFLAHQFIKTHNILLESKYYN